MSSPGIYPKLFVNLFFFACIKSRAQHSPQRYGLFIVRTVEIYRSKEFIYCLPAPQALPHTRSYSLLLLWGGPGLQFCALFPSHHLLQCWWNILHILGPPCYGPNTWVFYLQIFIVFPSPVDTYLLFLGICFMLGFFPPFAFIFNSAELDWVWWVFIFPVPGTCNALLNFQSTWYFLFSLHHKFFSTSLSISPYSAFSPTRSHIRDFSVWPTFPAFGKTAFSFPSPVVTFLLNRSSPPASPRLMSFCGREQIYPWLR